MNTSSRFDAREDGTFQILWEDADRVFCRGWRLDTYGNRGAVLAVAPAAEHPSPSSFARLAHEFGLKDDLDSAWAVRPLELRRERGRTILLLEDHNVEPLERLLGLPMAVGRFLDLAVALSAALRQLHERGLVHKDIKPANILVNPSTGEVRLTGFGLTSRLPRERHAPAPPETIAGTLAYMAPEQTGRMNRSIDSRSDLYALGVTLYQMLTGALPFTASEPMEWVHCHIARRPVPPAERLADISGVVSAIIMKLLAKTAEERYQTAGGVERDLRSCLAEWKARGSIDDFPLGQEDTPDRLLIPEKLYGRTREVETLLGSFDRVVRTGAPKLVLISGYSGIGKSSVVNELHKVLVPARGLFAAGKFDQYKRDIPYAMLVQAFQGLVRPLLGKSEAELARWRETLLDALGANGRLMVDLVPELELVIGDQPPVPELPPQDAKRRFELALRRFIGVFARPEHPLALFLDDLQWLDAATLDLVETLLSEPEMRHILLIGAYRNNEVDAAHPLMRKLDTIKKAGGKIEEITLAPLAPEHLGQLIADALRCSPERALPLTRVVHEKTAGNPFFVLQFLYALAEERLLAFDDAASRWTWDVARIRAKGYTDNVVDLMVGRLARLPAKTQTALHQLACLGNAAEIRMLALVLGTSEADVDAALWEALRQELVERLDGAYWFIHDRVQEAAYSLILEGLRAEAHLGIGRLLAANIPAERREEAIFDIVNQLNRGAALIHLSEEREQVAELNLLAGKRAKASTAYASALNYLAAGRALLPEDAWDRHYRLAFDLELHQAECAFLTGALADAEEQLAALAGREKTAVDRADVTRLRLDIYTTLGRSDRAVEVSLEYLRRMGIDWRAHPTKEDVRQEYEWVLQQLGARPIEELARLPLMTDPLCLSTLAVLASLQAPARFTDENLPRLVAGRMTNLSLEHGNSDASPLGYVWFGQLLTRFGDYQSGLHFARVGLDLVEKAGLGRYKARVYLAYGHSISPWNNHVSISLRDLGLAFEAAQKVGDLTFASYARNSIVTLLLFAGEPLSSINQEAEDAAAFIERARFDQLAAMLAHSRRLIKSLRGQTERFGSLTSLPEFDEDEHECRLETGTQAKIAACWYWIRKLQARFFAQDPAAALDAAAKARQLLWTSQSNVEEAEYLFYAALALAGQCEAAASTDEQEQARTEIIALHRQLRAVADNCPENFENRAALVAAEIARIDGRALDAMELYEEAIRSARANGFIQNEALANELASRFYAARGLEKIARLYLQDARYGYLRWGALGKVKQLEALSPHLREEAAAPGPTDTIGTPVEHLDLATVLKVSQAVSGEIMLEKLIDTLLRTALEHAGAERALLILAEGDEPRIEAEATTDGDKVVVRLSDQPVTAAVLPESVLQYVLRTRESVILDDAVGQPESAADPYIRERRVRSILCVPLITQAKLIGALYLENNLAPRIFAADRVAMLKFLASQASVALENTRLYRDLREREAKIRRLVDANIIGIFIFDFEGRIIEANDAFLRMVGYDRNDLASGRLNWMDLTPPEWRDHHGRAWEELKVAGTVQPYEREYFRKDGSRVPALIGSAQLEERRNEGVAFVLDLTERKRAAEALREVQTELAHANRVATMGQLTASIAHEVNQPIAAAVTNTQAALRWLAAEPPDLKEVQQALTRAVRDATRAGDVIGRMRELVKKALPRSDSVDMNEAIREVIELARSEVVKTGVSVEMELADRLPPIEGDRVQLQQVVLNLVVNAVQAMGTVPAGMRDLLVTTAPAEPNGVLVAVTDSGPGLPSGSLDRVFDPFYSTKPDGLGLGLSICQSIIEAHQGRLWVAANQPRGTVFHFMVPAHRGEAT